MNELLLPVWKTIVDSRPKFSAAVATLRKEEWMSLDAVIMRAARAKLRGLFELPDNQVLCNDYVTVCDGTTE